MFLKKFLKINILFKEAIIINNKIKIIIDGILLMIKFSLGFLKKHEEVLLGSDCHNMTQRLPNWKNLRKQLNDSIIWNTRSKQSEC